MARTNFYPTTQLTLLESLRDARDPRWAEFADLYGPVIFRIARSFGLQASDAEDVVGVVMGKLVRRMQRGFEVDQARGRFRDYLRTVTRHAVYDQLRKPGARVGRLPEEVGGDERSPTYEEEGELNASPDAAWEQAERLERCRHCFERLRASNQVRARDVEAFMRYAIHGEPAARVAKELGLSRNRLYGVKYEVLKVLGQMWKQLERELGEA